jgi:hypothetical protein
MKMLLLLALLLTLDACQNPSRLQAMQSGPPEAFLPIEGMSLNGGLCCKTILSMWARNIDSRSRTAKQLRFKSALVPIRLFQNPIPQLLYGDFCNTICHKRKFCDLTDLMLE